MSSYDVWTIDDSVYEYARSQAKARAKAQWDRWFADPNSVNLWTTYNTAQNANWQDPWLEKELGGFFNGPSVNGSLAYEVTQNAYPMFCWFKYHGYSDYCIQTLLTVCWNECRMGMGSWEGNLCPYSFSNNPSSLIGFSANSIAESGTHYDNNWYQNSSKIPGSYTSSVMDEVTHITYQVYRQPGSWAAYNRWEIDTYTDPDTGLERVRLDGDGNPEFYIPSNTRYCVIGYGIVQWTNWTRLVRHARLAAPNYGGNHWQFNATLQLMTLEKERQISMSTAPADQSLPSYEGEWVNSYATRAYFTYNGTEYHYPYACTWDNWASGGYLSWVETKCADLGITNPNTIENYKQLITFDILGRCYLHSSHYNTNFSNLSSQRNYFKGAINYWNNSWDILDVPRARDIPNTELDNLHIQAVAQDLAMATTNKRRGKRVCTILL